jgi:hypothetical protein
MSDVSRINHLESIPEKRHAQKPFDKRKQKKRPRHHSVKRNIQALTKIAEEAHEELQAMNSPFRLCIYQKGEEVFIDVVAMDAFGKAVQVFRNDITNDELEDLIHQIKTGRGLMFNLDA